jgi:Shedu protein SduA, C-terminal
VATWIVFTEEKSTYRYVGDDLSLFPGAGSPGITEDAAPGDRAALLRPGTDGGIIAHGRVREMRPPEQPEWRRRIRYYPRTVELDRFYIGNPISYRALRGLTPWAKTPFQAGLRNHEAALKVPGDAWQAIMKLADQPQRPLTSGSWNIRSGTMLVRSDVHDVFGGHRRGPVAVSGRTPNVFVFIDDAYPIPDMRHRWSDDGALVVSGGRSQVRDLRDEHYAVLTHLRHGKALRLFRMCGSKNCTYLGEFVIDQDNPIEQWIPAGQRVTRRHKLLPPDVRDMVAPMFRVYPADDLTAFVQAHDPLPSGSRDLLRLRLEVSYSTLIRPDPVAPTAAAIEEPLEEPATESPELAEIRRMLAMIRGNSGLADAVARIDETAVLAEILQRRVRRLGLEELRKVVEDPVSSEHDIQKVLQRAAWVFGGDYTGETLRRRLTAHDELDFVLVRSDGTLHGVEIKRAYIPDLIARRHRHAYAAVGRRVFEAFTQAMNYLRSLDEHRNQILADFELDCRRMTMTVLIGHSRFVHDSFSSADVAEAVRTFNAEHARIQIMTYDDLIVAAQRSLDLSTHEQTTRSVRPRRTRQARC